MACIFGRLVGKAELDTIYDIVVVGGGVSGCMAAIAAGRLGSRVLVIEKCGFLGGALTSFGVGPMMTFFAGEKQVIQGLMGELVERLVARGYSTGHVRDTTTFTSYITPFDAEGLKIVLDEMLEESGCTVLFHTMIGAVQTGYGELEKARIEAITVCNKQGLSQIRAQVFIDATGDADLAHLAGVPTNKGRESDKCMQPLTMNIKMCNVDTEKLRTHVLQHMKEFQKFIGDGIYIVADAKVLAIAGFREAFQRATKAGELTIPRNNVLFFGTNREGEYIINTSRIIGCDSTDPFRLSEAEQEGRRQAHALAAFFKKYVEGFQHAMVTVIGPSVGIRQSRQVKGVYTLTSEDIFTYKKFQSTICYSAYPVDIHNPNGSDSKGIHLSDRERPYHIPYEIMITHEFANLLITGRCVSATFEAQAAIRTTPTVGALGHACGVAAHVAICNAMNRSSVAALHAISGSIDVRAVDIKEVQSLLVQQGAYLQGCV